MLWTAASTRMTMVFRSGIFEYFQVDYALAGVCIWVVIGVNKDKVFPRGNIVGKALAIID
jgi:hypothetical protein